MLRSLVGSEMCIRDRHPFRAWRCNSITVVRRAPSRRVRRLHVRVKTEGYSDRQDNAHYAEYSPKLSEHSYCLCIPKYGQLHATRGGLVTRLSKHNTGRHSSCHGGLPGRGQHNAAHDASIDPRGVSAVTRQCTAYNCRLDHVSTQTGTVTRSGRGCAGSVFGLRCSVPSPYCVRADTT